MKWVDILTGCPNLRPAQKVIIKELIADNGQFSDEDAPTGARLLLWTADLLSFEGLSTEVILVILRRLREDIVAAERRISEAMSSQEEKKIPVYRLGILDERVAVFTGKESGFDIYTGESARVFNEIKMRVYNLSSLFALRSSQKSICQEKK